MDLIKHYEFLYGDEIPFDRLSKKFSDFLMSIFFDDFLDISKMTKFSNIKALYSVLKNSKISVDEFYALITQATEGKNVDAVLYSLFKNSPLFEQKGRFFIENKNAKHNDVELVGEENFFFNFVNYNKIKNAIDKIYKEDKKEKFDNLLKFLSDLQNDKLDPITLQEETNKTIHKAFTDITKSCIKQNIINNRPCFANLNTLKFTENYNANHFTTVENYNVIFGIAKDSLKINDNSLINKQKINLVDKYKIYQQIEKLDNHIFGQDEALKTVKETLLSSYFGFRENNKPFVSLLFTGPTGVGKTEMGKAISKLLFNGNYLDIDLSKYVSEFNISALIGASPNYVGYGDKPILVQFLEKNQPGVIIFNEIDKCHPSILNIFLEMLDEGKFVTATGETYSLENIVIIFTTNKSEHSININNALFTKDNEKARENLSGSDGFLNEFLGRVDEVIEFKHLTKKYIKNIVTKFINEQIEAFQKNNNDKNIKITYDESIIDLIVEKSDTKLFGARNIKRAVKNYFTKPVSKQLVKEFKKNNNIDNITINVNANKISFLQNNTSEIENIDEDINIKTLLKRIK